MVYRVFVEKKPELANEAKALLNDVRNLLGITALENVRLLNCYDAENISKKLFDSAIDTVFSEPSWILPPQTMICPAQPSLLWSTCPVSMTREQTLLPSVSRLFPSRSVPSFIL